MLRLSHRVVGHSCLLLLLVVFAANSAFAQLETATVSGQVADPSGLRITGAQVSLIDIDRDTTTGTTTNASGLYTFPSVRPGRYRMAVTAAGFKVVNVTGLIVNVQDHLDQNFKLAVGSVSESVTVEGQISSVDTESATVSTVVDRNFAENLPLNGRSFQTLIDLTPGVVLTATSFSSPGQFSVNGQRASSNYFTVDGVSANVGILAGSTLTQTAGGSTVGFSVTGGTNNLASEDALQEFRVQTSTFAPEFGRTPGAQISIVTRSGTNQFHGTLFEYLRNDIFDANDWFSDNQGLPKSEERINDFGGVLGGPIVKNRTFFFFSYEGQRLRLPQTGISTVPTLADRQGLPAAIQPFVEAYPLPNSGTNNFVAGFSNSSTLNATSVRLDQNVNKRLTLFGRYNYAPSDSVQRGGGTFATLNTLSLTQLDTQTLTLGATWSLTAVSNNEFRFNYSRVRGAGSEQLDTLGGAIVPPTSTLFPAPYSVRNAQITFSVNSLQNGSWGVGKLADNLQRQFNLIDTFGLQKGPHNLKVGVDYRRLSPVFDMPAYQLAPTFADVPSLLSGTTTQTAVYANTKGTLLFHNLGLFAQDTWRIIPRLTMTFGVRWDVDFAPTTATGPGLLAVTGFDPSNLSNLALAQNGAPIFSTKYNNFAPRIGLAYQIQNARGWESVIRGGFGIFYDLATQEVGNALGLGIYPFGAINFVPGGPFPLNAGSAQPPAISLASLPLGLLVAFDPHLHLPRTLQWNLALSQTLGNKQLVSLTYLGAQGHQLLQQQLAFSPNANFGTAELIGNFATSNYNALQLQYLRRLSGGLQVLASYTWSHSIDDASSSSLLTTINSFTNLYTGTPKANRGPSDFDVREAVSAGVTYDIPTPTGHSALRAAFGKWSLDGVLQARSATPVNVYDSGLLFFPVLGEVRPDLVSGIAPYLYGQQYPGGKALKPSAFTAPPIDPVTGLPAQGDAGRNSFRGFGATQLDFGVRREFVLREPLRLQFRGEFFNLLNHPNFANPVGDISQAFFGRSTATLAQSLGGSTAGTGGFAPIFQIGGPRSIQLGLKLLF